MFYINKEEVIFPHEVFNRLSKERQIGFIQITDEEHEVLINKLNNEQKTFTIIDNEIVYNDIIIPESDKIKQELSTLQSYLTSTDYMVIKCIELEVKMSVKYPEDFIKRQEARDRINELRTLL